MPSKNELRKKFLKMRNSISKDEIVNKSINVCTNIFSSPIYYNASSIFTYINIGSEVRTVDIIKKSLLDGKKVFVPKIYSKDMDFFEFKSFDDLIEGKFGLFEPSEYSVKACPDNNSIFLVPGLVFDYKKFRIGYGKGYYDYYFSKYNCHNKIGLAFNFQLTDNLIHEHYDIPMDYIVTENKWIY